MVLNNYLKQAFTRNFTLRILILNLFFGLMAFNTFAPINSMLFYLISVLVIILFLVLNWYNDILSKIQDKVLIINVIFHLILLVILSNTLR